MAFMNIYLFMNVCVLICHAYTHACCVCDMCVCMCVWAGVTLLERPEKYFMSSRNDIQAILR